MASEIKIRSFLAVPLGPLFESFLVSLIEKSKKDYPSVRWIKPSEIHLTLHFFGSVSEEEIGRISQLVQPVTQTVKSFKILLEGLGAFPNPKRPRVIWVGVGGETEPLKRLHDLVEDTLKKAGFPCEGRPFKPHLTIGRLKDPRDFPGLRDFDFGPTEERGVDEVILFKSHLTPQGAHYEALETYPLSGS